MCQGALESALPAATGEDVTGEWVSRLMVLR